MTMATIRSLEYLPPGSTVPSYQKETKSGAFKYDGNPLDLSEWKFRTQLRWEGLAQRTDDQVSMRVELVSKVIEGLSDEALRAARELPTEALMSSDGVPNIIAAVEQMVIPKRQKEAERLFEQGHKKNGVLAKQPKEPMGSYVARRKRWYNLLRELDPESTISESILTRLLLKCSKIKPDQKLMIKSLAGSEAFDKIATQLVEHQDELAGDDRDSDREGGSRRTPFRGASTPYRGGRPYGRQPYRRRPPGRAYIADKWPTDSDSESQRYLDDHLEDGHDGRDHAMVAHDDEETSEEEHREEPEGVMNACYYACSVVDEGEAGSPADLIEQDILSAFVASGSDLSDPDTCDMISEIVQNEQIAFYGRERARQHGVSVGKKIHEFKPMPNSKAPDLSFKTRQDKLKQAKSGSTCNSCGEKGHWAGDPGCEKKDKKKFPPRSPGGYKKPHTASFQVSSRNRARSRSRNHGSDSSV
jgi:hypothetical protein